MIPRPPPSTLFPYTTLFRSIVDPQGRHAGLQGREPQARLGQHVEKEEDLHEERRAPHELQDRKSTRLNSSHVKISYAVFCLKKKNNYKNSISHYIVIRYNFY